MSSLPLCQTRTESKFSFSSFFSAHLKATMKMFWSRVSYWLRCTLTYVVACKLVNNHCTLCQFHTWWSHQSCWGSNVAQRGTQWSHRTARSVPCVCVPWSWSPPGAALVQLGWLHIEGMWPSDCPEAFATIWWMPPDRPRSTQVVPFFFLPSRCLVTAWVGGGGKTREENQREILACEISAVTSTGEPPSPQRSSSDSLPSAGSKKKSKKSKTLPVCYWFKYFPKLQAQETVVVLAARPARRQKSFQRNIGLKNDRRKRETG